MEKLAGSLDDVARKKAVQDHKQVVFYEGEVRCAEYYLFGVLPGIFSEWRPFQLEAVRSWTNRDTAFG
jgi:hypothetical protein